MFGMLANTSQSLLDRLQTDSSTQDWEVFSDIYRPFLRRHLLQGRVPVSDVDDLCQDIFSRVFEALPAFEHNGRCGAFRCWLGRIVSQQRWQYFQQRQRQPLAMGTGQEGPLIVPSDDELQEAWEAEHDRHVLSKLLELIQPQFTRSTWLAFVGVAIDGQATAEVARDLGLTPNAVMVAKSRVLSRLRNLGRELLDTI